MNALLLKRLLVRRLSVMKQLNSIISGSRTRGLQLKLLRLLVFNKRLSSSRGRRWLELQLKKPPVLPKLQLKKLPALSIFNKRFSSGKGRRLLELQLKKPPILPELQLKKLPALSKNRDSR